MTTKEYKRLCRIRVTHWSKFITYAMLMVFFGLAEWLNLSGYMTAGVGTTIWFYMPDLAAYILEHIHKVKHDFVSYRG